MKLSRRNLMKGMAAGAMAAAATDVGMGRADTAGRAPRYGMVIDLRKCFGCHACSVACKAEQDVSLGYFKSWVIVSERGDYPNVRRQFLPVLCNQCENPPCVDGCPTGATWQRADGIVMQDEESCIGCAYCVQACPYDVKYLDPRTKTAQKCDFCVHRVEQGLLPACVSTCNGEARVFGDLNDPHSKVSRMIRKFKVQPLLKHMGTDPRVFYIDIDPEGYRSMTSPAGTELRAHI
jgi:tetrathionate reductase subunit B